MKKFLAALWFFTVLSSFGQEQNTILKLQKVQVKLPAKTKETVQAPYKLNELMVADSTAQLKVLEIDLVKGGMSKKDASQLKNGEQFWTQTKQSVLKSFGDVEVIDEKYITYKDEKVLEIVFVKTTKKGRKDTVTFWLFVRGEFAYQLFFSSRGNKASDALKKDFFDIYFIE